MGSHIIFVTAPFEITDIPLGTLVPDIRYPNQDTLSIHKALPAEKFSKRPQKNLKGDLDSEHQKSLKAQLTKLLTLSAAKRNSENLRLQAEKGWIYELRQPKELFHELCATEELKVWLREGLEAQQESYFVVGVRTFENASVGRGLRSARAVAAGATVPVGEVVKANTGVSPGDAADVSAKVETKKREKAEESFETEGELVYAIEYRKVIMKKRQDSDPTLSKDNVWRYYSDTRTAGGEVEYEEYETTLSEDEIRADAGLQSVEGVDHERILLPAHS